MRCSPVKYPVPRPGSSLQAGYASGSAFPQGRAPILHPTPNSLETRRLSGRCISFPHSPVKEARKVTASSTSATVTAIADMNGKLLLHISCSASLKIRVWALGPQLCSPASTRKRTLTGTRSSVTSTNRSRRLRTVFGGLFLFAPGLVLLGLDRIVGDGGMPGSAMILAGCALRALPALKLRGIRFLRSSRTGPISGTAGPTGCPATDHQSHRLHRRRRGHRSGLPCPERRVGRSVLASRRAVAQASASSGPQCRDRPAWGRPFRAEAGTGTHAACGCGHAHCRCRRDGGDACPDRGRCERLRETLLRRVRLCPANGRIRCACFSRSDMPPR